MIDHMEFIYPYAGKVPFFELPEVRGGCKGSYGCIQVGLLVGLEFLDRFGIIEPSVVPVYVL